MASILDAARRHDRNLDTFRSTEMHGLVTSYDPKNHLAKVTLQPWGYETGWLEIHTSHIGETYGIAIGLQTGSGMGADAGGGGGGGGGGGAGGGSSGGMNNGDQVVVSFQEDDSAGGKITGRVHSTQDKPLQVQSGECAMWTIFKKDSDAGPDSAEQGQQNNVGQKIFFKNDGGLYFEDGAGAGHFMDGMGNRTSNAIGTHTTQIIKKRDSSPFDSLSDQQSGGGSPQQIHHVTLHTNNNSSGGGGGGGSSGGSGQQQEGIVSGVFQDKHQVTLLQQGVTASADMGQHKTTWDQNGVTHTSSSKVTSQAPNIPHIGNSSVSQNLTVSQIVTAQTYDMTSDIRLKVNIQPLSPSFYKVMQLRPKTFDKKVVLVDEHGAESISPEMPRPSSGFIAQEVREIFPHLINGDETKGYLRIQEGGLVTELVSAFQEYVTKTDQRIAELELLLKDRD